MIIAIGKVPGNEQVSVSPRVQDKETRGAGEVKVTAPSKIQPPRFVDPLDARYLTMYGLWVMFLELKFINEKQSPFNTHQRIFCITSPATLCIAILISWGMSYLKLPHGILHSILSGVLSFSSILAQILLLFVLFIPPNLNWIGYAGIGVVFACVAAYTFLSEIESIGNKMIEIVGYVKANFKQKSSTTGVQSKTPRPSP